MGLVLVSFAADQEPKDLCGLHGAAWCGPIAGERVASLLAEGAVAHAAVGDGALRLQWMSALASARFKAIIDPSAIVSVSAQIAEGVFVGPRAIINARATIEAAVIVNSGAIVEHDCIIGRGSHVSPGAILCGTVTVGALTHIGAGAVVLPGIRIGQRARVGAGAVVTKDVDDGSTVVGVPANARADAVH